MALRASRTDESSSDQEHSSPNQGHDSLEVHAPATQAQSPGRDGESFQVFSSEETQDVETQEDDDDDDEEEDEEPSASQKLWPVKAILDEKKNKYLLAWEGIDPDTGKQWAPTWESKDNATRTLVAEWERKKLARKNKGKSVTKARAAGASSSASSVSAGPSNAPASSKRKRKESSEPPRRRKRVAFESPVRVRPDPVVIESDKEDSSLESTNIIPDSQTARNTQSSQDIIIEETQFEHDQESQENVNSLATRARELLELEDDEGGEGSSSEVEVQEETVTQSSVSISSSIQAPAISIAGPSKPLQPIRVPRPSAFFPPASSQVSSIQDFSPPPRSQHQPSKLKSKPAKPSYHLLVAPISGTSRSPNLQNAVASTSSSFPTAAFNQPSAPLRRAPLQFSPAAKVASIRPPLPILQPLATTTGAMRGPRNRRTSPSHRPFPLLPGASQMDLSFGSNESSNDSTSASQDSEEYFAAAAAVSMSVASEGSGRGHVSTGSLSENGSGPNSQSANRVGGEERPTSAASDSMSGSASGGAAGGGSTFVLPNPPHPRATSSSMSASGSGGSSGGGGGWNGIPGLGMGAQHAATAAAAAAAAKAKAAQPSKETAPVQAVSSSKRELEPSEEEQASKKAKLQPVTTASASPGPLSPVLSRVMQVDPVPSTSTSSTQAATSLQRPTAQSAPVPFPTTVTSSVQNITIPPAMARQRSASPLPGVVTKSAIAGAAPNSRNASPAPGGNGLPALIELIKASPHIENGDATKAELLKYVQAPAAYPANGQALASRALWAFELRRIGAEKTDLIIVNVAEKTFQLKRVPNMLAATLDVAKSLAHASSRPAAAAAPRLPTPIADQPLAVPPPPPSEPLPPSAAGMTPEQIAQAYEELRHRVKQYGDELIALRSVSAEVTKLRSEITALTKTNRSLSAYKENTAADLAYVQRQYQEASNAAVARANEAVIAEAEAAKLRLQLDTGLKQQKMFQKSESLRLNEEIDRLRAEVGMLKAERKRGDTAQLRENAARWVDHLEKQKAAVEESDDEDTGDSLVTASTSANSQSQVFACEWRKNPASVCGAVSKTRTDLESHVLEAHIPPPVPRLASSSA